MIYDTGGDTKVVIKDAKVSKDVKFQKAQDELNGDIKGYFSERDKTNRGLNTKIEDAQSTATAEAEVKELLYKDSLTLREIPNHVKPMFNHVFLSAKRNKTRMASGLWTPQASFGTISETDVSIDYQDTQIVMSIGDQVQSLEVGMEVKLDFEMFKRRTEGGDMRGVVKKEFEYKIPIVNINGNEYIKITEREVEYISNTNK